MVTLPNLFDVLDLDAAIDGKPIRAQAWAAVRPDAERPYGARGEDVA